MIIYNTWRAVKFRRVRIGGGTFAERVELACVMMGRVVMGRVVIACGAMGRVVMWCVVMGGVVIACVAMGCVVVRGDVGWVGG